MNVTLKLPDHLVREARHLALDENTSLSSLVGELLINRLKESSRFKIANRSWIDAFSGETEDAFLDRDFPLEDRNAMPIREYSFQRDPE